MHGKNKTEANPHTLNIFFILGKNRLGHGSRKRNQLAGTDTR
jgi:hypothetical protein